ncbi:type I secretion C-terminal target domain-containing protein [Vibrio caribbeanicus]|uniref:type I secretion C-terminal target domain-containing protein n=1 Tax=Vibrio caribbeanicus TaxID=701175 RepID=UPI0022848D61|nr:type I secretion C-terminal target domain-containing protein [Vibrio caribbeanicus]MCY9843281.1 type I secretion C-terminal target domain-containing protein [Vibrio caribbeanicus]
MNDGPTISSVVNGAVSEEGLTDGNIDDQGSGDTTNSKVFTGSFNVADSDSDNLNVSISGPAGVTSGGEEITWSWDADNQTLTGSTPSASVIQIVLAAPASNSDVGEWTYTATLLAPIDHSDPSTEDVLDLDINLVVSDGHLDAQSIITIKVEDDSPDAVNIDAVNVSVIDIPDVLTGKISFKGSNFSGNQLEKDGVVVTAVGFLNNDSAETGAVNVNQSSHGLGVQSPGNLGHQLSHEVEFRYAGNQGVSEQLVISLDGKVAYGATIEFDHLYGGEKEEGVAHFYRDGELIASQSFSSDASSGDYARHFSVQEGGFDKVVLEATSNGNDHTKADNSDFTVASITFTDATSDVAIAHVEGTLQGDFGADGAGSLRLTGAESGLQTRDGSIITVSVQAQNPNRVSGYDDDGKLVFDVHFTPATGAWEFMQYQTMLSPQGDGDIDFSFKVLDADGDSVTGTFAVNPYIPPTITVTANNFVEDSGTTSVGDAAAIFNYTVNSTSNSEITFASDSNLNQHYQLDLANNAVILTDKGLTAINKGEQLDKINLIVTEHIGSYVESSSASATPQVTPVDDAPEITVTANDFTEDAANVVVGAVAGTYQTLDEEGHDVAVDFSTGKDSGHYTLSNGQVLLTQAGVDVINAGNDLATIELTATANGLEGHGSATPNVIQTNDAPTIENVTTGSVSEEGLASGIQDDLGSPDTTNDTSVNGSFVISDVDSESLTVSLTGPDGLTSGGESITWSWNAVENKLIGSTSTGTVMEITVTEPNDNGKGTWDYTATLLKPLDHQNDTSEDALSVNLGIVASDGSIETNTPLVISVEDDALVVTDKAAVDFTLNNLPDVVTGQVSFRGNSGSSNTAQLLADKGIIVTALGFTSYESNVLGTADVNQSQHGIGVHSSASLGLPFSNEVDYRFANNSEGKPGLSEELIIDLQGKVAFGAAIEFDKMFSNEPESGVATFYRNGVEVFEQTFSSDKTSGDYAKNFDVHEGGFDKIVLKATGNGNTASQQDNSDFTVASITFPDPSDKTMIARAEGTLQIEYGADGFGSVGNLDLVEAETGLKTANGHDVVVSVNANDKNSLVGRDTNGQLVFEVHLTPTTGQWEFFQYESMLVPQGDNDIDFTFVATDGDGDKVTGVFSVNPFTRPVINVDGKVLIEDDGVAEGTVAASYSTHYENSEVTVTITEGTDPNAYYTLDSVNQTVKLTEAGAAEVNAGNNLPPVSLTVVHNSANTTLKGIGEGTPTVQTVNDAPEITVDTFATSGKEDETFALKLSELIVTDEEGDAHFIKNITVDPQYGKLTLIRDGENKVIGAEFKPAADRHFIGDNNVQFEVTVSDGDKQSTATVGLNIEAQVDRAVVTATMSDSPEIIGSTTMYPVDINIELLDRDGSERIDTVTISGIPQHSTIFANDIWLGNADQHGNIIIDIINGDVWDNDAKYYIKLPGNDTQANITVTATIVEQSTGEQQTSSDTISLNEVIGHETTEGSFNNNLGDANDIVVGDLQGAVVTPGTNHNVAFMIDTSGSISSGDMAEIQKQMKQVVQELKDMASSEHAGEVNVFIADFDNPTHTLASVNLKDDNAVNDLYDMIDKMSAWGGTNYEDVFKTTANWFESDQAKSNTDAINMAYFVTDGYATAYNDEFTYQEVSNWFVQDSKTDEWKRMSEVLDEFKEQGSVSEKRFTANDNIPGISDNGNSADSRDVLINKNGRIDILGVTGEWRNTPYHVRPDGEGGFEVVDLIGGRVVEDIDYDQATDAFNQHLMSEVDVEAIGIGDGVTSNYLEKLDTDNNVTSQIDVTQLADRIMGRINTLAATSDTIRGNDGDDILFGDSIRLPGTTEQGYDAIESYVAGKLGLDSVSDAQVGHYIREHASEFEYSNSEHKNDFLEGRKGSDVLFGQGGNDQLDGGEDNDILIGGLGNDILTGGEGSDLFKWVNVENGAKDVIKDFDRDHGDRIDLSDIFEGLNDTEVDQLLDSIESSASVNDNGHATITVAKGASSMTIEFENISSSSELTDYLFNQHGLKYNDY